MGVQGSASTVEEREYMNINPHISAIRKADLALQIHLEPSQPRTFTIQHAQEVLHVPYRRESARSQSLPRRQEEIAGDLQY